MIQNSPRTYIIIKDSVQRLRAHTMTSSCGWRSQSTGSVRRISAFAGILVWLLTAYAAHALPILADISSHRVEIHSAFTGTQLMVFGARNDPGDIVIVIRGPESNFIVRKKERFAGIWINRQNVIIPQMPEYYRIASSRPLDTVRQHMLLSPLDIAPPVAVQGPPENSGDALITMLARENLHSDVLGTIDFMGPTLFKASFDFPDNMPRGNYTAEAYLFSDGALVGMHTIPVEVYKIGFDALMYEFAHSHSLLYGIAAVLIALLIGSSASWIFRRLG